MPELTHSTHEVAQLKAQGVVTIGIPTCNRAATLGATLKSAVAQQYSRLQIVVADNASTDNTLELCKSFHDDRISCFSHPRNIGAAANFVSLLEHASSEYFVWLADDDWLDPVYVAECVRCLENNPDAVLAYGHARYYKGDEFAFDGTDGELMQDAPLLRLVSYFCSVKDNAMFYGVYRRKALSDIGIGSGFAADWLFLAQVIARGKVRQVPCASIHRRLGGASASTKRLARSSEKGALARQFPFLAAAIRLAWLMLNAPAFRSELSAFGRLAAIPILFGILLVRGGLDETGHLLHGAALRCPAVASFIKKKMLGRKCG